MLRHKGEAFGPDDKDTDDEKDCERDGRSSKRESWDETLAASDAWEEGVQLTDNNQRLQLALPGLFGSPAT